MRSEKFIETILERSGETRVEEILGLLKSKNRSLERLMEATRAFLAHPLENLIVEADSARAPLGVYENERGTIIKLMEFHDRKINSLIAELPAKAKTPGFMADVKSELDRNEVLIRQVFNADDTVFSRIREAQTQITRLLQENRKSRDYLSKFKSGTVATGEEMDQTL